MRYGHCFTNDRVGVADPRLERQQPEPCRAGDGGVFGIAAVNCNGDIRFSGGIEAGLIRLALGRNFGHMTEVAKRIEIG